MLACFSSSLQYIFPFEMTSSSPSFNQTLEVTIASLNRATISVLESSAREVAPALEINNEPEAPPNHRSYAWLERQTPGLTQMPLDFNLTQNSDTQENFSVQNHPQWGRISGDPCPSLNELDDMELDISSQSSASTVAAPSRRRNQGSIIKGKNQKMKVMIQCPICLDTLSQMKATNKQLHSTLCGHLFCCMCIKKAVTEEKKCPACDSCLDMKRIHPLYLFQT